MDKLISFILSLQIFLKIKLSTIFLLSTIRNVDNMKLYKVRLKFLRKNQMS